MKTGILLSTLLSLGLTANSFAETANASNPSKCAIAIAMKELRKNGISDTISLKVTDIGFANRYRDWAGFHVEYNSAMFLSQGFEKLNSKRYSDVSIILKGEIRNGDSRYPIRARVDTMIESQFDTYGTQILGSSCVSNFVEVINTKTGVHLL